MYKIFYMCVSYDLEVSNEDFCCLRKNSSDIFKQWKAFPCLHIPIETRAGDGRIGGSYENREFSKELIKEKFLLVAKCCTRTFFYA